MSTTTRSSGLPTTESSGLSTKKSKNYYKTICKDRLKKDFYITVIVIKINNEAN